MENKNEKDLASICFMLFWYLLEEGGPRVNGDCQNNNIKDTSSGKISSKKSQKLQIARHFFGRTTPSKKHSYRFYILYKRKFPLFSQTFYFSFYLSILSIDKLFLCHNHFVLLSLGSWEEEILVSIQKKREEDKLLKFFPEFISGQTLFGLMDQTVKRMIESVH